MSYDDDAGDRLIKRLEDENVAQRANLATAAELAGRQLETIKPSIIMTTADGLIAGPVADVARGTLMFVLADAERVMTLGMSKMGDDDGGWIEAAEALAALGRKLKPAKEGPWNPEDTIFALSTALLHHGRPFGTEKSDLEPELVERIVGALLAGLPASATRTLFAGIAKIIEEDVCPVLVGLIGPSTSGAADKFCGAWPLLLPLAPYAEAVMTQEG